MGQVVNLPPLGKIDNLPHVQIVTAPRQQTVDTVVALEFPRGTQDIRNASCDKLGILREPYRWVQRRYQTQCGLQGAKG